MTEQVAMREAYGKALVAYGDTNRDVVVLDADTSGSTFSRMRFRLLESVKSPYERNSFLFRISGSLYK